MGNFENEYFLFFLHNFNRNQVRKGYFTNLKRAECPQYAHFNLDRMNIFKIGDIVPQSISAILFYADSRSSCYKSNIPADLGHFSNKKVCLLDHHTTNVVFQWISGTFPPKILMTESSQY